jgi:hypothetical protein
MTGYQTYAVLIEGKIEVFFRHCLINKALLL